MDVLKPELFREPPSCVLLDLDNTFYSYDEAHRAGMDEAEQLAGRQLNLSPLDFRSCLSDARQEIKYRLGRTAASHHRLIYFQRTLERAGYASQPLIALRMEQAYWRAFMLAARLFEQATEFLDDLRIAGIPMVFVTDLTAQVQFRKIIHFGLDRYVDWIVTSEEVGGDKPLPAMFEYALAKIGGVEGQVWMIGEEPRSDIGGSRTAIDAVTLQKRHAGVEIFTDGPNAPDLVFDEFSSVRKLLAEY